MGSQVDESKWNRSRLIPVSGMRSVKEQEQRATSGFLAVLSSVDEFGHVITKPFGAPKGKLQTFIEVPFDLEDGRKVRPDGVILLRKGKRYWTALLEVKTGTSELDRDQIESYLDVAKEQGFDCVITVSNQITRIPGQHPVTVDKRKIRRVGLHHLSWSHILTEAMLQKAHRGVADSDQAWILGELIRYLQHPNAGSIDFSDMGEHWVAVRDAVKNGILRSNDKSALEVAGRWEELLSFAVLQLGRKLGADVQEKLTKKERDDIGFRIANITEVMVADGKMPGNIRIPNTVGDISIVVDLRAQQVIASVSIDAPKTGKNKTKINWLLRQLKPASAELRLDSWGLRSRSSMADLLGTVRENPARLNPVDDRDIASFSVSLSRPMGLNRTQGKRSFIDSVLSTIDEFYAEAVQHLREWQPPTPKLDTKIADNTFTPFTVNVDEAPSIIDGGSGESPPRHDSPDDSMHVLEPLNQPVPNNVDEGTSEGSDGNDLTG